MHNNAHICAAPQVIITCKDWKHRAAFVEASKAEIDKAYEQHKAALGSDVIVQKADMGFDSNSPLFFKAGVSADPNTDITGTQFLEIRTQSFMVMHACALLLLARASVALQR